MCPTAATVMWNVLVQHFSQIRLAIDVVPVPVIRDVVLGQVSMRERRDYMAPLCMAFHELDLIPVLRRLDSGGDGGGSGSEAKGDLHCSASSVLALLCWFGENKETKKIFASKKKIQSCGFFCLLFPLFLAPKQRLNLM